MIIAFYSKSHKSKVNIQGLVEVDGNTCSGSESFEEWEEGAIIEEVRSDVFS